MKLLRFGPILPIILLTSCFSGGVKRQYCSLHYSYFDGKQYEFRITEEDVYAAPSWDPHKAANPPLSASKALDAAERFIAEFPVDEGTLWDFEELALTKVCDQHWAWRAEFRYVAGIVSTGPGITMQCWVLMNGKVIQPHSRKDKRYEDFMLRMEMPPTTEN